MPPDPPGRQKTIPPTDDLAIADLLAAMEVPGAAPKQDPRPATGDRATDPGLAPRPAPSPRRPEPAEEPRTVPVARNPSVIRPPAQADDFTSIPTEEPFLNARASRVAILGGKGTGKSYLFQSIVHRCEAGVAAGALAPWLKGEGLRIFTTSALEANQEEMNKDKFLGAYRRWTRLPQTLAGTQRWYKLRLGLRRGFLGLGHLPLEVEFFDGAGELLEAPINTFTAPIWNHFARAPVVVFCLPMWMAFPSWRVRPTAGEGDDWRERLEGFNQLAVNLRKARGSRGAVRTVLALTMADDRRVALDAVKERWIRSVMADQDTQEAHLAMLRTRGGLARYVDNARVISEVILREMGRSPWTTIKAIPQRLDFGAGPPWIVPMSAMDGERLTRFERDFPDATDRSTLPEPIPAHVELPLLVGLCDRFNALM